MKRIHAVLLFLTLLIPLFAFPALPAAAEPEGGVTLKVDDAPENICFGIDYPLPVPTAFDEAGNDVTDRVTVTVQHHDGNWTDISGFSSAPWQPGMTVPVTEHTEYRVIYAVPEGGENAKAVKLLHVMDTLLSISVSPSELRVPVGSAFPSDALTVTALRSKSGSAVLLPDEYALNTENVIFETAGEYTALISVTAPYGGTKTAEIRVTVYEPDPGTDLSSLSLRVNAEGTNVDIPFGGEYTAPDVTVTATDADGSPLDLSGNVLVSVWLIDGDDRLPVEGHENQPDSPDARRFPITVHGVYAVVYSVTNGSLSESAEYTLTVHDTLQSVSVLPDVLRVPVGTALPLDTLSVRAVYSLSGEITVPADGCTLNADNVDTDTAGEYSAFVSVTAPYGGTKTAEIRVIVYGDDPGTDLSSVSITVDGEKSEADVPFGSSFTIPGAAVTATDANGNPVDLSGNAVFSVFHGNGTGWTPVEGMSGPVNGEAPRRITITERGVYKIVYSVTNGDLTAEAQFLLNVLDTLTGISVQTNAAAVFHPGDRIDPGVFNVTGVFSDSGSRRLTTAEYTVSPAAAPQKTGDFAVTVTATFDYAGITVKKTASLTMTVVPAEQKIDKSRVTLTVGTGKDALAFGELCRLPDVTAAAFDEDGNEKDAHDSVTWTLQHASGEDGEEWKDVEGFVDLPITQAVTDGKPLLLLPAEHGHYRVLYRAEAFGKEDSAVFSFSVMDTLLSIKADLSETPAAYSVGEDLDLSRLIVNSVFSLSGTSPVPGGEYRIDRGGYDRNTAGTYTVTISYSCEFGGTKTDSFSVTVTDPFSGFTVTSYPVRRVYVIGDPIDLTGLEAKAFHPDRGEVPIGPESLEIRGYDPHTAGTQTVEFLFRGVSGGSFEITVNDALFSIEIDASGVAKEIGPDGIPDYSGLKVTWIGVSGQRHLLTPEEYTVSPSSFKGYDPGSYSVTVSCRDESTGETHTASFRVSVTGNHTGWIPFVLGGAVLLVCAVIAAVLIAKNKER